MSVKLADKDLIEYLAKSGKDKIEFKMSNLIGFGGECVVIRKNMEIEGRKKYCAIRAARLNEGPKMLEELGIVQTDTYDRLNVREMAVEKIDHPNIIKYLDNTFEFIDDKFHHLTGKLTFKTLFSFPSIPFLDNFLSFDSRQGNSDARCINFSSLTQLILNSSHG